MAPLIKCKGESGFELYEGITIIFSLPLIEYNTAPEVASFNAPPRPWPFDVSTPTSGIEKIALLRVDVDAYSATLETLEEFTNDNLTFDIIFIDANHTEVFLTRDIENSLKILNTNGVIILHDVNPPDEFSQIDSNNRYQTAWKAFVKFRFSSDFFTYSYATDCGLGVIDTSKTMKIEKINNIDYLNLKYEDLEKHREHFLGFIQNNI